VVHVARALLWAVRGEPVDVVIEEAEVGYRLALEAAEPSGVVAAIQAMLRSRYASGDIEAVECLMDPLDRASREALLPFGIVRVSLCRAMNALARGRLTEAELLIESAAAQGALLRTHAAAGATTVQRLVLMRERDELSRFSAVVEGVVTSRPLPSVWNVIAVLAGDEAGAASLRSLADEVPVDDAHAPFVALAAEVALAHRDIALAQWCTERLERLGDATVMTGLGTVVLGFARHFAGVGRATMGDHESARLHLRRAADLAARSGASLWESHSLVELAHVMALDGDEPACREATRLLDDVRARPVTAESARLSARCRAVDGVLEAAHSAASASRSGATVE
jgi:hypothetical protein